MLADLNKSASLTGPSLAVDAPTAYIGLKRSKLIKTVVLPIENRLYSLFVTLRIFSFLTKGTHSHPPAKAWRHSRSNSNIKLIFAISEKDMSGDKPRFSFKNKKDESASYFQPFSNIDSCDPANNHGYILTVPTGNFTILEKEINSATEIRALYSQSSDYDRKKIIENLYGRYIPEIKQIFDNKLTKEA